MFSQAAHIYQLPTEVILEIFKYSKNYYHASPGMLRLAHVCRSWRRIIHGYSAFWATIYLLIRNEGTDQKLAFWLERAGGRPPNISLDLLSFTCDFQDIDADKEAATLSYLKGIAKLLRSCMTRWVSFSLQAEDHQSELIRIFVEAYDAHTPLLQNISISISIPDIHYDDAQYLGDSPVVLPVPFQMDPFQPPISVNFCNTIPIFSHSVTDLRILTDAFSDYDYTVKNSDLLDMFRSCPNLITFSMQGPRVTSIVDSGLAIVERAVLPHLTTLHTSDVLDVDWLLELLEVSTLLSLHLIRFEWSSETPEQLRRIFSLNRDLEDIQVRGEHWIEGAVPEFAVDNLLLSSVKTFTFHGPDPLSSPVLQRLQLPELEVLDLKESALEIAIELIWTASSQLRSLSLNKLSVAGPSQFLQPFPLPSLTSLTISDTFEALNYINPPQLESLSLSAYNRPRDPGPFLLDMLERSVPRISILTFEHAILSGVELCQCFRKSPHIQTLVLSGCHVADTVLEALATPQVGADAEWLLPQLASFRFLKNKGITSAGVIPFLAARHSPIAKSSNLPRIRGDVYLHDLPSRDDYAKIQVSVNPS